MNDYSNLVMLEKAVRLAATATRAAEMTLVAYTIYIIQYSICGALAGIPQMQNWICILKRRQWGVGVTFLNIRTSVVRLLVVKFLR